MFKALAAAGMLLIATPALAQSYRTYSQIGTFLQGVADDHPDITRFYSLGQSEEGRHIWALQISDNPDLEEDEPEFRYISTMHGDEWVGNEMCLYFIDHLTDNYGIDQHITDLVDEIDIWIVPLMNPDGYIRVQRYNAHGVDLNRDFPDPYTSPNNTPDGRAAETAVIMNWSFASSFMLSANMHTGALVVNYPFDNNASGSSVYTPTPDDDLFIWISEEYARHNLPMWNSPYFYHGITNGAAWYAIAGGMQDWNYHYMGSDEVTLELSDAKIPPASQLPTYWSQNRESMLAYMETCLIGVRGVVNAADGGEPLAATVTVIGRAHEVYTDPDVGDYHRMVLPGTYDLRFEADGYDPLTVTNVVVSGGPATRRDAALGPPSQIVSPNGGETLHIGVPATVTWTGSPTAQFQVQYSDNYGDSIVISDGFESAGLDPNEYETGGNATWWVTSRQSHSGSYSARAGRITHNQTSWLTRAVDGGALSFWYRVSSEANYDFLNFYVDGDLEIHASGYGGWTQYSTTLADGSHELRWEYTKDGSVDGGSDTAWIDDLEARMDSTAWTDIVALTDPGATAVTWTPATEGEDYKVRVRAVYGEDAYGAWDESDGTFAVVPAPELIGDLNDDCAVDLADLAILLGAYGTCMGDAGYLEIADIDNSGCVDLSDLSELLAHYGEACP
ncbi:MAG: M14 family zinc carboxypeptidase [Phycisphaerae bacterium]